MYENWALLIKELDGRMARRASVGITTKKVIEIIDFKF